MAWKYLSTQNCILVTLLTFSRVSVIPSPSDCVIKGIWPQKPNSQYKEIDCLSFSGWDPGQYTNWVHPGVSVNCFFRGHFGWSPSRPWFVYRKKYWYKEYFLLLSETVSTTHSRNLQVFLLIWLCWPIIVNRQATNSPCRFYIRSWHWIKWNKQTFLSWYRADWIKWEKDLIIFLR